MNHEPVPRNNTEIIMKKPPNIEKTAVKKRNPIITISIREDYYEDDFTPETILDDDNSTVDKDGVRKPFYRHVIESDSWTYYGKYPDWISLDPPNGDKYLWDEEKNKFVSIHADDLYRLINT